MTTQTAKIKLVDPTLPLPKYQTEGSAAFDLYAREETIFQPGEFKAIPLNICLKIPPAHVAIIAPRSSLYRKHGLIMVNSIGVIDEDYCGDNDEYGIPLFNLTGNEQKIEKGERICQVLLFPITKLDFTQVSQMTDASRGGFGSTGTH